MAASMMARCPLCGELVELQMEGLAQRVSGREAIVRVNTQPFVEHLNACNRRNAQQLQQRNEPSAGGWGDVDLMSLALPGKRACTMCGTSNVDCLRAAQATRAGCCPSCTTGATHPHPQHDLSCAEWGAEHGAQ